MYKKHKHKNNSSKKKKKKENMTRDFNKATFHFLHMIRS